MYRVMFSWRFREERQAVIRLRYSRPTNCQKLSRVVHSRNTIIYLRFSSNHCCWVPGIGRDKSWTRYFPSIYVIDLGQILGLGNLGNPLLGLGQYQCSQLNEAILKRHFKKCLEVFWHENARQQLHKKGYRFCSTGRLLLQINLGFDSQFDTAW